MTPTCINKLPNNYIAYKSTFKFTNISFASIYALTYSISYFITEYYITIQLGPCTTFANSFIRHIAYSLLDTTNFARL